MSVGQSLLEEQLICKCQVLRKHSAERVLWKTRGASGRKQGALPRLKEWERSELSGRGAGKGTEVFHEYSETDRAAEGNQGRGC